MLRKPIPQVVLKNPGKSITLTTSLQDNYYFWALSWLEQNSNALANTLVNSGSIATEATSNLLSRGNTSLITKISDLYADYKQGLLTKGQYDYQRRLVLQQLKRNVGPMEKVLFGNRAAGEAIRIARGGGVPATAYIEGNFVRLSRVAKYGKNGGIFLAGVGLAASCVQIAHTQDQHAKNDIFVETVTSTTVGAGTGVLVGIFLVFSPVGWGAALVLAVGTVATSYLSGKAAKVVYDRYGNRVDLVSGMGVDRVCR